MPKTICTEIHSTKVVLFRVVHASHIVSPFSVVLLAVEDSQNSQEQVDDVQIQRDRSSNLLLNMIMSHDQLCVHQDVPGEDECRDTTVCQLDSAVCWEECSHEAEQDQSPQSTKQVWHP